MSNTLAIGAVTAALRSLLERGLAAEATGLHVTTLPPDKAAQFGPDDGDGRVNLFLYQTQVNTAWRNLDLPRQVRAGETGQPPLGLDLFYLVTTYEKTDGDSTVLAHRLLGRALRTLFDHPLLGADEIEAALAGSGVPNQVERIRITPHPMSLEEVSKLWVMFQTSYRVSAAYQVSVVLIESTRPTSTPLPVLQRGPQDQGVTAVASGSPVLFSAVPDVEPAGVQLAACQGDNLILRGSQLPTNGVSARFSSLRLSAPVALSQPLSGGSATEMRFHLPTLADDPNALDDWAPGFYNLALIVQRPSLPAWTTNDAPFMLAPAIGLSALSFPAGAFTLDVTCSPRLRDGQRVLLLFGDRQFEPAGIVTPSNVAQPTTLSFAVTAPDKGKYVVRLRVDGVDSLPVVRVGTPPKLAFDPAQTVTIT